MGILGGGYKLQVQIVYCFEFVQGDLSYSQGLTSFNDFFSFDL